jgi:osmoprotectant transport system substrate-binding protein
MRAIRTGAVGAALAVVTLVAAACGSGGGTSTGSSGSSSGSGSKSGSKPHVIVGSQNFSESTLLAYIYGDALKKAGFPVTFKTDIGPRATVQPALQSGQINFEPEYVGNLLADFYDSSAGAMSAQATAAALKPYLAKHNLEEGNVSQAADSDAIAVNSATESKYHLSSIAQLAPIADQLSFGGPPECRTRVTCIPGLEKDYGIHFKNFVELDAVGPLTINALKGNQVQVARLDTSDPSIKKYHFTVLADPKHFQDAGNIIPEFAKSIATTQLLSVVNTVSATLTTNDLINMNSQIENSQESPATVAQNYVSAHHLG